MKTEENFNASVSSYLACPKENRVMIIEFFEGIAKNWQKQENIEFVDPQDINTLNCVVALIKEIESLV